MADIFRALVIGISVLAFTASGSPGGAHLLPSRVQIYVDGVDRSLQASCRNLETAYFPECEVQAHNRDFLHSNTSDGAWFQAKFDIIQDGCYSIEEYHPSIGGCSQQLTSNARLDVDWASGKTSTAKIDETILGGRWNFLGVAQFIADLDGRLMLSSKNHLAVDAFRLKRVEAVCTEEMESKLWQQYQNSAGLDAKPTELRQMQWQAGSLHLRLSANSTASSNDLLVELQAHAHVLERTMMSHLGAMQVTVQTIVQAEELSQAVERGLERIDPISLHFEIHFEAEIPSTRIAPVLDATLSEGTTSGLRAELSNELAAAGAILQLISTEVSWHESHTPTTADGSEDVPEEDQGLPIAMIMLFTAIVFVLIVLQAAIYTVFKGQSCCGRNADKAPEQGMEVEQEAVEEGIETASTATPTSDHAPESDQGSVSVNSDCDQSSVSPSND